MATDYDAPLRSEETESVESLEELQARREQRFPGAAVDEAEEPESVELPGADLSSKELTVPVVPLQPDEFVCAHCYTIHTATSSSARPRTASPPAATVCPDPRRIPPPRSTSPCQGNGSACRQYACEPGCAASRRAVPCALRHQLRLDRRDGGRAWMATRRAIGHLIARLDVKPWMVRRHVCGSR
ncbi:DUF4193 family protein [Kitasatospora aureofaciens]|uniref:DUF4193 family protein n=1 Tax=Kitasatospora aureofaciens TaxID=1894 RepID=UPI003F4BA773